MIRDSLGVATGCLLINDRVPAPAGGGASSVGQLEVLVVRCIDCEVELQKYLVTNGLDYSTGLSNWSRSSPFWHKVFNIGFLFLVL